MKLHPDQSSVLNTVTGYGDGYVEINARRFDSSVIVGPEWPAEHWPVARFEDLSAVHFERLLEIGPDIVLLGTGRRQRFPSPRLTQALLARRIGVEVMDTPAACRTYNILMTEGRLVLAALLQEA
ncbi:MAG: Mth938-like domain-containing protein [Burkholderiaceae bacterium]